MVMNSKRRLLRKAIQRMSTREATAWIKSFQLRQYEEDAIIACDVKGMSVVQASFKLHCSREVISRHKSDGYNRILRDIKDNIPE